jgi:hypothetical protein
VPPLTPIAPIISLKNQHRLRWRKRRVGETASEARRTDTVIFDYARRKNVILVLDWLAQPNQSAALMRFLIPVPTM